MIYIIEIDCICLFALMFVVKSMHSKGSMIASSKYIYHAGYFTMLVIVMDILSLLIESKHVGILNDFIPLNYLVNILYYLGPACSSYLWFMHVEYTIDNVFWSKKKNLIISQIPVFLSFVLSVITVFNGVLFYIDSNNSYNRGPFFYINNIICYSYAFVCCIHALFVSLSIRDYLKKKQLRLLACYIFFPVLFALIQLFFPEIPTILVGMTIPVIYIYTEFLDLQISTDYLTGLNNRNQLMRYLDMLEATPTRDKEIYLFMLDVDSFKKINDTYGHAEGDRALIKTAEILKSCAGAYGGFVARLGGDEFTYVAEFESEESVAEIKAYFEKATAEASKSLEYTLGLSVGCGKYTPGLKISELFQRADTDMYAVKAARK
ncbi:MAG: GGDEF domain-containing protein, partial [Lachnospiraceae bacterium]|nr:GGDEF domain-containing protein [Lachnospiraceae bacterium]